MIHAALAALFCVLVALFRGPAGLYLWPGVFYVSREFAQAEYRYVLAFCDGSFAHMPRFAGFYPISWNQKSMLDWILPVLVSLLFWYMSRRHHTATTK